MATGLSRAELTRIFQAFKPLSSRFTVLRKPRTVQRLLNENEDQLDAFRLRDIPRDKLIRALKDLSEQSVFISDYAAAQQFPHLFPPKAEHQGSDGQDRNATLGKSPSESGAQQTPREKSGSETGGYTPGFTAIDSINPFSLPYSTQHLILDVTQEALEQSCFAFAQKMMPEVLAQRGLDCGVALDLIRWLEILRKNEKTAAHIVNSINRLESKDTAIYIHMTKLRNIAVHRASVNTGTLARILVSATKLAKAIGDGPLADRLARVVLALQRKTQPVGERRQAVTTELLRIQEKREALDREEKNLIQGLVQSETVDKAHIGEELEGYVLETFRGKGHVAVQHASSWQGLHIGRQSQESSAPDLAPHDLLRQPEMSSGSRDTPQSWDQPEPPLAQEPSESWRRFESHCLRQTPKPRGRSLSRRRDRIGLLRQRGRLPTSRGNKLGQALQSPAMKVRIPNVSATTKHPAETRKAAVDAMDYSMDRQSNGPATAVNYGLPRVDSASDLLAGQAIEIMSRDKLAAAPHIAEGEDLSDKDDVEHNPSADPRLEEPSLAISAQAPDTLSQNKDVAAPCITEEDDVDHRGKDLYDKDDLEHNPSPDPYPEESSLAIFGQDKLAVLTHDNEADGAVGKDLTEDESDDPVLRSWEDTYFEAPPPEKHPEAAHDNGADSTVGKDLTEGESDDHAPRPWEDTYFEAPPPEKHPEAAHDNENQEVDYSNSQEGRDAEAKHQFNLRKVVNNSNDPWSWFQPGLQEGKQYRPPGVADRLKMLYRR